MTIEEYAIENNMSNIDVDVEDTEIDIYVPLLYQLGETNTIQEKILDKLIKNVQIVRDSTKLLVCDFSGYLKKYNDKILDYCNDKSIYIADYEDSYYWLVEQLPSVISGYANNTIYNSFIEILS